MGTKRCYICKEIKDISCFYKDKRNNSKNNYLGGCKFCRNEYTKAYNKKYNGKAKLYAKRANKKQFGLTLEEFEERVEKQKGLCAICGLPQIDRNQYGIKDLAIDHNHNTGKVRGLLCSKCNRALGLLNTDNFGILNLQKAIEYLEIASKINLTIDDGLTANAKPTFASITI